MRLKITLIPEFERQGISINYNHHVATWLCKNIIAADPSLEKKIFDEIDCFTFSKLLIPKRRFAIIHDKIYIDSDKVELYFSTIHEDVGEALYSNAEKMYALKIGEKRFFVDDVKIFREKSISSKETFVTLSPITVSENGNYIFPNSKKYFLKMKEWLMRKAEKFGCDYKEDFEMRILKAKPKLIRVFDSAVRCLEMAFQVEGCENLLELGYKTGFGKLNTFGFGMVKA
ncbi:CRISPR-associated protein Cas6 [Ferroglobus placidus DSM 10642]|uniref:CRISPR-associated protein Cas6 n=1 Tax=Ferroglobus placidus (strain DSM 10642 / AEDII12DO) TaxID=589924 RepID=D3RWK8_FERPA|nr:CRISPR-associated endoribonuclease Cas6 [Ferroglobus placidus]ADC64871.1 CRISPR-associated protein Cas6 [Ferroglobus placidus DSM 10642]